MEQRNVVAKARQQQSTHLSDLTVKRAAEVQQQLAMACGHHWHDANEAVSDDSNGLWHVIKNITLTLFVDFC